MNINLLLKENLIRAAHLQTSQQFKTQLLEELPQLKHEKSDDWIDKIAAISAGLVIQEGALNLLPEQVPGGKGMRLSVKNSVRKVVVEALDGLNAERDQFYFFALELIDLPSMLLPNNSQTRFHICPVDFNIT